MEVSPFTRRLARASASRLSIFLSIALLLTSLPSGLMARQQEAFEPALQDASEEKEIKGEFVPGDVLVRFRDEATAETAELDPGILSARGQSLAGRVERFQGSEIVRGLRLVKVDPSRTLEAIKALNARADVLYAEPNYIRHIVNTPNDPQFPSLYGLTKIGAPAAWDITQGSQSVVVGVIDQGVQVTHPDLQPNVWTNPGDSTVDGVDNDSDGFIDDVNGWDFVHNDRTVFDSTSSDFHATHVAGTVGARGNNATGVVGVNWQVSIMSLKVLDGNGGAGSGTTTTLVNAYNYALTMKQRGVNLRALNNSYGGGPPSQSELLAIRALSDAGILFVVAAGNDSRDNFSFPDFPSNYDSPNVIAVASTDSGDNLSNFSNFSSRLVSIGAPGSSILSTYPVSTYNTLSGTSMATPHVTGAAALVVAAKPGITMPQLRGVLAYSGDIIPALQNTTTTGRRLNVFNAIQRALENDTTAPAQALDLHVTSQSGRSVTLQWTAPGDDGNAGQAADYDFFFVNPSTGLRVLMPTTLLPAAAGTQQTVSVNVPFVNFSGTIEMRTYDDTGNFSASSVAVNVPVNPGSDPYVVTESAAQSLSTGGTRLALDGDDKYLSNFALPFALPFYGQQRSSLTVSTNGALYFSTPARRESGDADDVPSSVAAMQGQIMIAGLWDDLIIDGTGGVFVVQPDASRVIFRWQGVTFASPRVAVNFEIELRNDGTILTRYGTNSRVFPVVGISGGEPSAYIVASHTRECADNGSTCTNQPISLTNAATVTFAPRTATPPPAAANLQFSAATYTANESSGAAVLTITRTGDASSTVSVDVRTIDSTAIVPCADTSGTVAFARCDYVTTVQTVFFNAGDSAPKTVNVPLVNDAHVEPNETVQIALSNPSSAATLGTPSTTVLTIVSDDAPGAPNPILSTDYSFFVRQQYLDFFGREPDAGGFNAWKATLDNCADPFNTNPTAPSAICDRISVSRNFFLSQEFALKGRFVFNFYRVAFNRLPQYAEIIPDIASLTAVDEPGFFAKKAAFTNNFVQRQEFKNLYDALSNQQFVDALMNRYSLSQITTPDPLNPDGTTKITLTRAEMVARLNLGTLTRAQSLRALADSNEVGQIEANSSFVAMQYFGYLRRDPEPGGYNDWLNTINANPADIRSMVNGFMNSNEYKLRFGSL